VRQALAGRPLWLIIGLFCLSSVAVIGIQVNVVPMMTDEGLPAAQAGLLLTIYGLASLLGRLVGGVLLDRVPARFLAAGVLLSPVVGIVLLQPSLPAAAAGIALVGLALGAETDLLSYLVAGTSACAASGRCWARSSAPCCWPALSGRCWSASYTRRRAATAAPSPISAVRWCCVP
jgi:predicted MFS family arabinose efflux permease